MTFKDFIKFCKELSTTIKFAITLAILSLTLYFYLGNLIHLINSWGFIILTLVMSIAEVILERLDKLKEMNQ